MIKNAIIPSAATSILSGSASAKPANVGLYLCNITPYEETINVYAVQSGFVPSDYNAIVKNLVITGSETFEFGYEKFILEDGEQLQASG